jgi:23S rRNA (guanine745-N1)-methyltransferase
MCCKSLFVCGKPLEINGKNYKCENNHSFDAAKSGYINLLTSDRMNTKNPGDNKQMVNARSIFLDKGYYAHLRECLSEAVAEVAENGKVRNKGEFYISVDGTKCYYIDSETNEFVLVQK